MYPRKEKTPTTFSSSQFFEDQIQHPKMTWPVEMGKPNCARGFSGRTRIEK